MSGIAGFLAGQKVYFGKYDMSGDLNRLSLKISAAAKDKTTFGNMGNPPTVINQLGLQKIALALRGLQQYGSAGLAPDEAITSYLSTNGIPITVDPTTSGGLAGDTAYLFQSMVTSYTPLQGSVGDLAPYDCAADNSGQTPLVRGTLMQPAGAQTTTGVSATQQLGAVSATQAVFATLHILSASGTNPTLNVIVQSSASSNMGSPTTRVTFAQQTGLVGVWGQSAVGAITDTYWNVSFTIGGTATPTFSFVVAVGFATLV